MKTENKISKLAIVSALCAMIAVPSYAASSVRALGGSGTYNGTTSAANAKSGGTGSAGTMRAGSMRVNNATSGTNTRVTSSRTATSPRLSIGKYLGGSSVISGGSSSKPMNPGQSGVGGPSGDVSKLSDRVAALEQFTGYSENGDQIKDTVADLVIDVAALQADLSAITGEHTIVEYNDGFLTIIQEGKTTEYDLAKEFVAHSDLESALQSAIDSVIAEMDQKFADTASKADLEELSNEIDEIIAGEGGLTNYYTKTEADSTFATKSEIPTELSDLIGADSLVDQDALDSVRTTLESQIAQDKETYATKESLESVSTILGALEDNVYTKAEVDKKITDAVTDGTVDLNGYATTSALETAKSELNTEIAKKANIADLGELATKNLSDLKLTADNITSINGAVIERGTITAAQLNTGSVPVGNMAMLIVGANGEHEWVSVTVVDEEDGQ